MPIKIPDGLPAQSVLENEHIFVITENRALHQDIRPLKIGILNLMPTKIVTETQIMRSLSNTPLQFEVELIQTSTYHGKNTPQEHLLTFYKTFDDIRDANFDGFIITGAPVEQMEFEEVDYWQELCQIMEWTKTHVHSTLHICWGAQAALYYHYGIKKHPLAEKISGVFTHRLLTPKSRLFHGFDGEFLAPHSRHTETRAEDIEAWRYRTKREYMRQVISTAAGSSSRGIPSTTPTRSTRNTAATSTKVLTRRYRAITTPMTTRPKRRCSVGGRIQHFYTPIGLTISFTRPPRLTFPRKLSKKYQKEVLYFVIFVKNDKNLLQFFLQYDII